MIKQLLYASCILLTLYVETLYAEIHVEITHGIDLARPIGIVPFQWIGLGDIPEDIGRIVEIDLCSSGKFRSLDRPNLPQIPNTVQEIQPTIWSTIGIYSVVIGQIESDQDGSYKVEYQLVDTSGASVVTISKNSYKVNKQWLRYAGHTVSDEVFEKLTGIKGAFRTRIAYVVKDNEDKFPYKLYVSDYDGYNRFLIRRSFQPIMSPAWSSDGSKIAYVTFESGRSALVIHTLSNGTIHQVSSFPCHNGAPAFSPDGTKLAFVLSKTGSLNLYVMDLTSEQIRQISDGRSNNTEPSWFPDSQNLAFTSDQSGRPQVYKININNGFTKRITWIGSQNQNANVSKDGKFMVMVNSTNGQQRIAKQDLLAGNVEILSSTSLDETPSLSPNGVMVIYSSSQDTGSVLNLSSTDGHYRSRLPITDLQIKFPAWSPYL